MRFLLVLLVLSLSSLAAAANDAPVYQTAPQSLAVPPPRTIRCVGCEQPSYPAQGVYQQGFYQYAPQSQACQSQSGYSGGRPRLFERIRQRRGCR